MTAKPKNVMLETIKSGLPPERRAAQIYKNKETEETNMDDMNMEITTSEHRAIVFKMNRKQAAAVARYLKEHSASPETIFAVDVDTMELIVQAKNAGEEDIIVLDGEEDVFDVEKSGKPSTRRSIATKNNSKMSGRAMRVRFAYEKARRFLHVRYSGRPFWQK